MKQIYFIYVTEQASLLRRIVVFFLIDLCSDWTNWSTSVTAEQSLINRIWKKKHILDLLGLQHTEAHVTLYRK